MIEQELQDIEKNKMNYFDHLEVVRWKILSVLVVFFISFMCSFVFIKKIVYLLQYPISSFAIKLYYFKPYEKFATYIKIAFYMGFIMVLPFTVFQIAHFIFPALKKKEKTWIFPLMLVIPIIFITGAYFSYRIISPMAFNFFLSFASGDNVEPVWSFGEYYSMLLGMMFVSGLVFQIPLILLALIKLEIITAETLSKARAYVIVGIVVLAAVLSPPDIISQVLIAAPLYLLFELALIIGRIITRKKKNLNCYKNLKK